MSFLCSELQSALWKSFEPFTCFVLSFLYKINNRSKIWLVTFVTHYVFQESKHCSRQFKDICLYYPFLLHNRPYSVLDMQIPLPLFVYFPSHSSGWESSSPPLSREINKKKKAIALLFPFRLSNDIIQNCTLQEPMGDQSDISRFPIGLSSRRMWLICLLERQTSCLKLEEGLPFGQLTNLN